MKSTEAKPKKNLRLWPSLILVSFIVIIGILIQVYYKSNSLNPDDLIANLPKDKVNIVILLIDALRADRLGVYGYSKPTSPNIDALAAESVIFEQCNAPAPWTLPSVVSMFTSTFPCEHGVVVDGQKIQETFDPLAVRLKKAGYRTCAFSISAYAGSMSSLDRGYDNYYKGRGDGTVLEQWLENVPSKPFYVYIHNGEPHNPYAAPKKLVQLFGSEASEFQSMFHKLSFKYRSLTREDYAAGRPLGTTDNTIMQQQIMKSLNKMKDQIDIMYDAAVREADERAGSIIETLKRRGLWDKTLFILTADHGEELGDHGGWQHDQSVYEELIHIPLIVHFPKGQYSGTRVNDVVSLVDLVPTIFGYFGGTDLVTNFSGTNLMPFIKGVSSRNPKDFVITAMRINRKKYYRPYKEKRGDTNIVVRQNSWKGIWNDEIGTIELYNLAEDHSEKVDISKDQIRLAGKMRDYARTWFSAHQEGKIEMGTGGLKEIDEDSLKILRSLGYVE